MGTLLHFSGCKLSSLVKQYCVDVLVDQAFSKSTDGILAEALCAGKAQS